MQSETWKQLCSEFEVRQSAVSQLRPTDRWAFEVAPMVGLTDDREVVASPLFIGWATPAWAVFVLGHEMGHTACDHRSLANGGRRLQNEVEADMWGVAALEAYGYDPREALSFLGSLVTDWGDVLNTVEACQRILALSHYLEHRDVARTIVSLPVA